MPQSARDRLSAARDALARANAAHREAVLHELIDLDSAGLAKGNAIRRLLAVGAYPSATAAEKMVEEDEQYALFLRDKRNHVIDRMETAAVVKAAETTVSLLLLEVMRKDLEEIGWPTALVNPIPEDSDNG